MIAEYPFDKQSGSPETFEAYDYLRYVQAHVFATKHAYEPPIDLTADEASTYTAILDHSYFPAETQISSDEDAAIAMQEVLTDLQSTCTDPTARRLQYIHNIERQNPDFNYPVLLHLLGFDEQGTDNDLPPVDSTDWKLNSYLDYYLDRAEALTTFSNSSKSTEEISVQAMVAKLSLYRDSISELGKHFSTTGMFIDDIISTPGFSLSGLSFQGLCDLMVWYTGRSPETEWHVAQTTHQAYLEVQGYDQNNGGFFASNSITDSRLQIAVFAVGASQARGIWELELMETLPDEAPAAKTLEMSHQEDYLMAEHILRIVLSTLTVAVDDSRIADQILRSTILCRDAYKKHLGSSATKWLEMFHVEDEM